ncbi:MAG: hypothetical protein GY772_24165 [bacterium]|nr:hypothetical protein [bacterium]
MLRKPNIVGEASCYFDPLADDVLRAGALQRHRIPFDSVGDLENTGRDA